MNRRIKQAIVILVVGFAAAQFVRPDRTNPSTDPNRTIQRDTRTMSGLVAVLDRACNDCHSNATVWPWYTEVAPLSWIMALAVKEGRKAINFSDWAAYRPEQQRSLLVESCRDASSGKMPGSAYIALHSEARLSTQDIETICSASRKEL